MSRMLLLLSANEQEGYIHNEQDASVVLSANEQGYIHNEQDASSAEFLLGQGRTGRLMVQLKQVIAALCFPIVLFDKPEYSLHTRHI